MIVIREYAHGTPVYAEAIQLRMEVLRAPLGLTFDPAELDREAADIHIGAFDEGRLVGTLTLTRQPLALKMRQVAVAPARQHQGIGRLLVAFAEGVATERGFRRMALHARETVVPFYLGLGYVCEGEAFEEVTLPHRAMSKELWRER